MKKTVYTLLTLLAVNFYSFGQQSVQIAIEKTDTRFVKEWIQQGHDINSPISVDDLKITPLSYAALKANPEMVSLLLNKGAQVNVKIEFQDALMFAARGGNVEIIESLLTAGANPMNENKEGKCARDLAKDNGNIEAHRILAMETEKRIASQRAQRRK